MLVGLDSKNGCCQSLGYPPVLGKGYGSWAQGKVASAIIVGMKGILY